MVRKSLGWSGAELNTKMPAGAYTVSSKEDRKSGRETLFTYSLTYLLVPWVWPSSP